MKVIYLYDNLPSYRIDFFSLLSKKLTDKGLNFKIIYGKIKDGKEVSQQAGNDLDFEVKALEINNTNLYFFKLQRIVGLVRNVKIERPDLVVLQFHVAVSSYWFLYFYLKINKIPYITWDCNYTRNTLNTCIAKVRKKMVDFTYLKAASCISYGTIFREYLIGIGCKPYNVFVAQNTINIERIFSERKCSAEQRSFDHPTHILYVGALTDRKNVDSAIAAISELLNKGFNIFFDIIGNGPSRQQLEMLVKAYNCEDRIIFHGAKQGKELQVFFENSNVLILPGTGGLVVNEAMAYGLPIISTKGDDTVIDLIDGNGFLLEKMGDAVEIQAALERFISLPQEEKIMMAKRSEEILFDWATLDNMVNKHIAAIDHVLNSNFS